MVNDKDNNVSITGFKELFGFAFQNAGMYF
jgi:hypothetical protein